MSEKLNPLWDEFILWSAVPLEKRGAVSSEDDWARSKGYSDARQMRRWKKDSRFLERQAELLGDDVALVTQVSASYSGDEADYQVVKGQLLDSAKGGNLKATELFMKLYGRSWIEEETAARSSDFTGMDLESLVCEALMSLSPTAMAGHLQEAGWSALPPAGGDDASDTRI